MNILRKFAAQKNNRTDERTIVMKNGVYPLYRHKEVSDIRELVAYAVARFAGQRAFTYAQGTETVDITYAQLSADIEALGAALLAHGLGGKTVAVLGENSYFWLLTYLAVVNSGGVIVPLDRELPMEDLRWLIEESGAEALVFSSTYAHKADFIKANCTPDSLRFSWEMAFDIPRLQQLGRDELRAGNTDYANVRLDAKKTCAIIYTSGTTGVAKGVMLSHRSIAGNAVAACKLAKLSGTTILALPLHHTFASTGNVLAMMNYGNHIVFNSDLKEIAKDMRTHSPSFMFVVPAFVEMFHNKIWENVRKNGKEQLVQKMLCVSRFFLRLGIDLRRWLFRPILEAFGGKLDILVCGGAPLDAKSAQRLRDFGIHVLNGYGITECSPIVAVNRNRYYRDDSVGLTLPGYEVRIDEPNLDGIGEICVKGDCVMLGYHKNEEATRKVLRDGWFHTGDLGQMDANGFVLIMGRIKNLIILPNGKNVYPEELEVAVTRLPFAKEAVVFAEGNAIVAEIFPDMDIARELGVGDIESALRAEIGVLNKTLPLYKNINRVVVRYTEFEKTTTKKIKRSYTDMPENPAGKACTYAAPRNQREADFAEILARVLELPQVGINDTFIDLGGDSLKAIAYAVELEDAGYAIEVEKIYEYPTVSLLAKAYDGGEERKADKIINVRFEAAKVVNNASAILLTGASGYLGAHLLAELARTTQKTIYCLVRDTQRLRTELDYYFGRAFWTRYEKRFKILAGNITREYLGVSQEEYAMLLQEIGSVINAAANVKHFGHWESFKEPNIDGVTNFARFCQEGNAALHHISTTAVTDTYAAQHNYYVRSKYAAEEIITDHIQNEGLRASIYRVGNLTERAADGVFQKNADENAFRLRLKAVADFGYISESLSASKLEFTPVDRCAEAVVRLIGREKYGEIFHIFNHNTVSVMEYAKEQGIDLHILEDAEFEERLRRFAKHNSTARLLLAYLHGFSSESMRGDEKTIELLKETGFMW